MDHDHILAAIFMWLAIMFLTFSLSDTNDDTEQVKTCKAGYSQSCKR